MAAVWTFEQLAELERLCRQGKTTWVISARLRRSRSAVLNQARRQGWGVAS